MDEHTHSPSPVTPHRNDHDALQKRPPPEPAHVRDEWTLSKRIPGNAAAAAADDEGDEDDDEDIDDDDDQKMMMMMTTMMTADVMMARTRKRKKKLRTEIWNKK